MATQPKGYSPVNGQPIPEGKPFVAGDSRAKAAQKKSAQARSARKSLRDELLELLKVEITDKKGKVMQTQAALSTALIQQALKGNTKAYEIIRDTIGEKPTESINVITADFSALDAAFDSIGDAG